MKAILKFRTVAALALVAVNPAAALAGHTYNYPDDPYEVKDISYYDSNYMELVGFAYGECTPSGATTIVSYGYRSHYRMEWPKGICEDGVFTPYNYG